MTAGFGKTRFGPGPTAAATHLLVLSQRQTIAAFAWDPANNHRRVRQDARYR